MIALLGRFAAAVIGAWAAFKVPIRPTHRAHKKHK